MMIQPDAIPENFPPPDEPVPSENYRPYDAPKALYDLTLIEILLALFMALIITTIAGALVCGSIVLGFTILVSDRVVPTPIGMLAGWVLSVFLALLYGAFVLSIVTVVAAFPVAIFSNNIRSRTLIIAGAFTGLVVCPALVMLRILKANPMGTDPAYDLRVMSGPMGVIILSVIVGTLYGLIYSLCFCSARRHMNQRLNA